MTWTRGCIYYSTLPDLPDDYKTVLVVSADYISEFLKPVVVQVTSRPRPRTFDTDVELPAGEGGLETKSWALCHQVATVMPNMVEDTPLGRPISARKIVEINRALAEVLDLPSSWPEASP